MKKMLVLLVVLLVFKRSFATEQIPDLLIIENDTFYIKTFPLEVLDLKHRPFDRSRATAPHTGCWRGYQAVWRLQNDSLYLEKILSCEWSSNTDKEENIKEFFQKNNLVQYFQGDKVILSWQDLTLVRFHSNYKNSNKVFIFLVDANTGKKTGPDDALLQVIKGKVVLNKLKDIIKS